MCDLNRDEQGAVSILFGDVQAAQAKLAATYPDVFTRSWIYHEGVLEALDEFDAASGKLRDWVIAKRDATHAAAAAAAGTA